MTKLTYVEIHHLRNICNRQWLLHKSFNKSLEIHLRESRGQIEETFRERGARLSHSRWSGSAFQEGEGQRIEPGFRDGLEPGRGAMRKKLCARSGTASMCSE